MIFKKTSLTLTTLLFIIFLDSFTYFFVMPIFLRLFMVGPDSLLAVSDTQAYRNLLYGLMIALMAVVQVVSDPLLGYLSDRFGRKRLMFICPFGLIFSVIAALLAIAYRELFLLVIAQIFAGIASSSQAVARAYVANLAEGKRRAFYLSLTTLAMVLAVLIGPLFGSLLSHHAVNLPYWIVLGIAIVVLFLLVMAVENDRSIKSDKPQSSPAFLAIWKNNVVRKLLCIFLIFEFSWACYYQVIYLYFPQVWHFSVIQISQYTTFIGLLMALGTTVIYALLLKYFSIEKIMAVGLAVLALGLCMIVFISHPLPHIIVMVLPSIAISVVYPSLMAWMADRVPPQQHGSLMGFANAILALSWALSSYAMAALFNLNVQAPFLLAAILMLLASLGVWRCR